MAVDTETAMSALFALLANVSGVTLKTTSRRLQFVEDMQPEALPAVFQNQVARNDLFAQTTVYGADFDVEWYVYCFQANMDLPTTPILNPLVDAVLAVLPPDGARVPLGDSGSTMTVSRAGPTHFFEGLLGERAVARIPLRIKVPKT